MKIETVIVLATLSFGLGVGTASAQNVEVDPNASPIMQGIQRMQNGQPIGDPCPYGCGHKITEYDAGPGNITLPPMPTMPDFTPPPVPDFSKPAGDIGAGLGRLIDKIFAKDPAASSNSSVSKAVIGDPIMIDADTPNAEGIAASICGGEGGSKIAPAGVGLYSCLK